MGSRSSFSKPHGSWLSTLLVAVVVGGISYAVFRDETGLSVFEAQTVTSTSATPTNSKLIVSVAGNQGSENYRFDLATRTFEKVDGSAQLEETTRLRIEPGDDGAFRLKDGEFWDVVLRTPEGQAYDQARIVGIYSSAYVAVVAAVPDGQRLLVVDRSGSIREAYRLPEAYTLHGIQADAVWVATLQPGEGIESPPQGPSTIIKIFSDGSIQTIKTVDEAVASVVIGQDGALAYGLESGEFRAENGSSTWEGSGRPLLWIDAQRLLIANNKTLKLVNVREAKQEILADAGGLPFSAVLER